MARRRAEKRAGEEMKEPKTSYIEKMILGEEEKAIAEKAADLIKKSGFDKTLKELEKDD